jgi:hypothetical protein
VNDLPVSAVLRPDLLSAFADTARSLYASEDLNETLERITGAALDVIGGCAMASVSVLDGTRVFTRAATDPVADRADALQYTLGEGPCLDAARTARLVHTPDTANDRRWPQFAPRVAAELAVGSMLSCRLSVLTDRERVVGSLNLYGAQAQAFSEQDVGVALLLGVHAGAVAAAALDQANMREAIQSRDVIGQAKGILMERFKVTADEAFERLRQSSQSMNVKLRNLAENLTATGEVP